MSERQRAQGGMMSGAFTKTVGLGAGKWGRVFVTIKWDGRRLSITGVEGPKSNGDARGSSGQCVDALDAIEDPAPGWSPEMLRRLKAEWERWHLNDMRAGCEHQNKAGWNTRPIDPNKPTNIHGKHFEGQQSPSWNMLVWVTRKEHPKGLLCEPCEVCGYKYGSAWLFEAVPAEVVEWLAALPESEVPLPRAWAS